MGRNLKTLAQSFFLFRRNAGPALSAHSRLLKERLRILRRVSIEPGSAVQAEIDIHVVERVHVAAAIAQFRSRQALLDAAGRQHDRCNPMLAPFVINRVARPELAKADEPGAIDRLGLISGGDQGADRKAREIVACKKSLGGEVSVDVEIRFCAFALIKKKLNFPFGFTFALLGDFAFFFSERGVYQ
jgi:hypothetical protein